MSVRRVYMCVCVSFSLFSVPSSIFHLGSVFGFLHFRFHLHPNIYISAFVLSVSFYVSHKFLACILFVLAFGLHIPYFNRFVHVFRTYSFLNSFLISSVFARFRVILFSPTLAQIQMNSWNYLYFLFDSFQFKNISLYLLGASPLLSLLHEAVTFFLVCFVPSPSLDFWKVKMVF